MKHVITKRLLIAGIALLTVPSALLAQKEKDKEDKKRKKGCSTDHHYAHW